MSKFSVSSVAVIGAGPAGLAAAKYLIAEKAFQKIDVFEQRSTVGGVWNYTPNTVVDESFRVPQTDPNGIIDKPQWLETMSKHSDTQTNWLTVENGVHASQPVFASPMYETLETNIPHPLMQFSDKPFAEDVQLFPKHQSVLQYIEEYAADVRHLIHFNTQVVKAGLASLEDDSTWSVTTKDIISKEEYTGTYDALIIANGHYNVPYIPYIEGLAQWNENLPGSISHSKFYRHPNQFVGKKVIVVGNSASGIDIGSQIGTVCQAPLIVSSKSKSYLTPATPMSETLDLPPISSVSPARRAVQFSNGHVEEGVDNIIFCTGYFYSYPFLDDSVRPPLIKDGTRVVNTYQHFIYRQHPTLALLALPQKVIPFAISEAQSAILARLYSNRISLPSETDMEKWEDSLVAEHGDADEFHVLPFPKDAEYINELYDWAMLAEPKEGLENGGKGKLPPHYGEWERWCRPRFPEMRKAFGAKGEARKDITTLDQLGFNFEEDMKAGTI